METKEKRSPELIIQLIKEYNRLIDQLTKEYFEQTEVVLFVGDTPEERKN